MKSRTKFYKCQKLWSKILEQILALTLGYLYSPTIKTKKLPIHEKSKISSDEQIMVKIGHETIFYILSKNSNDKKGFRFEASLIMLPDTWKHCLSPKRFYQISLKICKAVFVGWVLSRLEGGLVTLTSVHSQQSRDQTFRIHLNHSHYEDN